MKLVLDTSILIDFLRKGKTAREFFDRVEEKNPEFFIPTIVIYELFGGKSSANPSVSIKITNVIRFFKRVELTEQIAIQAGKLYRNLGSQISSEDYIIAASAMSINAQVVTLNKKHFQKIPGVQLYDLSE